MIERQVEEVQCCDARCERFVMPGVIGLEWREETADGSATCTSERDALVVEQPAHHRFDFFGSFGRRLLRHVILLPS